MIIFFILVQVFLVFVTAVGCHNLNPKYLDPDWVDPHDWSSNRDPLHELCPESDACKPCEKTVRSEYLRLVKTIFDPSQFRVGEI